MKDTFVLKTTIKEFSTMKECFEQEKIGKEDLIITMSLFIEYNGWASPSNTVK